MLGTNPLTASASMGAGSSLQGGTAGPATSGGTNNIGGNSARVTTGGSRASDMPPWLLPAVLVVAGLIGWKALSKK